MVPTKKDKLKNWLTGKFLTGKRPLIIPLIVGLIGISLTSGDGTSSNPFIAAEQRVNEYLLHGNSAWYQVKQSDILVVNRLGAGFVKFYEVRLIYPLTGLPEQPVDSWEGDGSGPLFMEGRVAAETMGEVAGEVVGFIVLLLPFYIVLRLLYRRSERFKRFVKKLT